MADHGRDRGACAVIVEEAKYAGFCKGVARAVRIAKQNAPCYTLGSLIHNRTVVAELEALGIVRVENPEDVPPGATVVLRSHGAPPDVYDYFLKRGVKVADATCPDVERNRKLATECADRRIIILGDAAHPEVSSLAAWCENPIIVADSAELEREIVAKNLQNAPVLFMSQTTGRIKNYELCVKFIKKHCTNAKICDTICKVTFFRQREAEQIAARCAAMFVVGSPESANTRHLFEICGAKCANTFLVENAEEVRKLLRSGRIPEGKAGLTAGASAPLEVIKEVKSVMEMKNTEAELSFEELLEGSFKTLTTGEMVKCVVMAIGSTELQVELGTKHAGYVPVSELSDDPDYKVDENIKVGDEIECFVMRVNDVEGTAMLSKKRVDANKAWSDIEAARENRQPLDGFVTEENKGGLVVSVFGVRVFVPASQTGIPKEGELASMLKKRVKLYITEVNRGRRRVVGSIRAAMQDERRGRSDEIWKTIEDGKTYTGVVKSLTSFGAFVDIGGVDGMVHVSELAWERVSHPSEILKVGDEIEVYVLSFDMNKRKISLGHKDRSKDPWTGFVRDYKPGDVVNVEVANLTAFGAFCHIVPSVDGLIHISQISDRRVTNAASVLSVGERVDVKIIAINHETKKVSLSITALNDEPISVEDEPPAVEDSETQTEE